TCQSHLLFFFSSARRHTSSTRDWSAAVCSSGLPPELGDDGASNARADLWSKAFPPSYEEHHTPAEAVADVGRFEDLDAGRGSAVRLYRPERLSRASVRLVLYRPPSVVLA